ncbi:sugar 3,4-ketoisomerase [Plebeiibacterium sediminum]|uniref:FdtA/QdtA family cupin domain-containing protein n=1 Tax=Plebeiibacterium sediminum TaxID=2992112 RepID=A0AAE3M291_9BACT|nr:FdtA/QdtA family cupin domain-containing protein [Plebeiobacterium sediminum]MCW3785517.1 FdtA/QdtA family cupin domain-containing protein [Plebeiobacterium sediminum]
MSTIHHCKIIDIPKISSDKGSLSFLESNSIIPFDIKRVYFTYDIPSGAERGGHAHKEQHEIVIAASGSFNIIIDDGNEKKKIFLNTPHKALHIVSGIWRELNDFSTGSVVLVMNSGLYEEQDYIRNYNEFKVEND